MDDPEHRGAEDLPREPDLPPADHEPEEPSAPFERDGRADLIAAAEENPGVIDEAASLPGAPRAENPAFRDPDTGEDAGPPRRSVFSLERRAAPGLYAAGWLLTGLGLVLLVVFVSSPGGTLPVVLGRLAALGATGFGLLAAAGAQTLQRKADRIEGFAGPSPFLVFAAGFMLDTLAVIPVLFVFSRVGLGVDDPVVVIASLLVNVVVYVAVIRLLVVGPGSLSWQDMGLWPPATDPWRLVADIWAGVSLALPTILGTLILAAVLVRVMGAVPEPPLPPAHGALGLIANLVAAAVIAPIWEELFFRGYATTAWARRLGPSSALFRGALFFAFIHVLSIGGSTFDEAFRIAGVTFVSRLPVAYLLGWVYLRRRSLYASISLHATFNGLLILLSVLPT